MQLEKNPSVAQGKGRGYATGLVLVTITLLVPGVGLISSIAYLFACGKLNYGLERGMYFALALGLGLLAFSIHPGPVPGGDVYRYYLEMNSSYVLNPHAFLLREKNIMNLTFYGLMHLIQRFALPKNVLSLVCILVSYFCTFSTLVEVREKWGFKYSNVSALIIAIFLYVYSPYTIFSNYRTFLSMSILSLGIARIMNSKRLSGIVLLVVGTVSHNAGWVITGLFLLSRFVTIPFKLNFLAVVFLVVNDSITPYIVNAVIRLGYFTGYLTALVNSYVYGRFSSFITSGSYGLVHWGRGLILLLTTVMVYNVVGKRGERDSYLNFIGVYVFFLISFFNFRMVVERFTLLGFVLFIPLYWRFLVGDYPKRLKVLFLLLMFVNFDVFNFMDYGIRVGAGFPWNLFEPSISLLKNYITDF